MKEVSTLKFVGMYFIIALVLSYPIYLASMMTGGMDQIIIMVPNIILESVVFYFVGRYLIKRYSIAATPKYVATLLALLSSFLIMGVFITMMSTRTLFERFIMHTLSARDFILFPMFKIFHFLSPTNSFYYFGHAIANGFMSYLALKKGSTKN